MNRTTLNYVAGARGRLSGLTVAAISALVLIADPGFIAYIPKFVLGGILLYLGALFIYEWLIISAHADFAARIRLATRHRRAHS